MRAFHELVFDAKVEDGNVHAAAFPWWVTMGSVDTLKVVIATDTVSGNLDHDVPDLQRRSVRLRAPVRLDTSRRGPRPRLGDRQGRLRLKRSARREGRGER